MAISLTQEQIISFLGKEIIARELQDFKSKLFSTHIETIFLKKNARSRLQDLL
jgi:hypothetical protein